MESWQHVRGAGGRLRPEGGERARAAGGDAAAAGEEGDRVVTVGGRFEAGWGGEHPRVNGSSQ